MVIGYETRVWIQAAGYGLLMATLLIASITDLKYRKIPNVLTISLLIAGMIRNVLLWSLKDILWQMLVIILLYLIGPMLMAPGDCKLGMGITTLTGAAAFCWIFVISEGMMLLLFFLTDQKETLTTVNNTWQQIRHTKKVIAQSARALPFAPALFFGTGIWILLHYLHI